mmetsp:Transcript_30490/g.98277  ORF Transcript_30490/g.98277 Transcript_30490/m.98277 type:complete len:83 (-) Transcript_30490:1113-1361(-)
MKFLFFRYSSKKKKPAAEENKDLVVGRKDGGGARAILLRFARTVGCAARGALRGAGVAGVVPSLFVAGGDAAGARGVDGVGV